MASGVHPWVLRRDYVCFILKQGTIVYSLVKEGLSPMHYFLGGEFRSFQELLGYTIPGYAATQGGWLELVETLH